MTHDAAPKHVFKAILICGASVCLSAFSPAAFAQRAGAHGGGARGGSGGASHGGSSGMAHAGGGFHGGGGARGGSSGMAHAGGGFHGGGGARGGSSGMAHAGGGFHGGGGARGGSSGMARAGGFHGGGSGGSFHGGGPYGGSGTSSAPHSSGGSFPNAPARMSSGGSSHLERFGSVSRSRANFTGNSFIPPPGEVRPAESGGRGIFVNANTQPEPMRGSTPVGARPFAAGNYLWEAPPQQRQQPHPYVAPRPMAPRPMTMPAPMRPTVMQPPSPIRPMPMPGAIPTQGSRPIQMPMAHPGMIPISPMPSSMGRPIQIPISRPIQPIRPIGQKMGGRFVAPRIRIPRPLGIAPAPPLFRPVPPALRALPVRPVFAGMALEPGLTRKPGVSFTAFGASNSPAGPCVNTITDCGIGAGFLDGDGDFDGDFDNGGFGFPPFIFPGFFGPFGFSPLGFGFGFGCDFDDAFQDCFLSPFDLSVFSFGGFGFNSFGFGGPYGSSYLYQPVENLPAYLPQDLGGNLPNTNYSLSYSYEPAPEFLTQQEPPPTDANANQPVVDLVMKDGTVFGVTSYWLLNDRLYYVTTYQIQSSIPMDQLDLQKTVDMNWKRGVAFTLTPQPPAREPQQNPQPRP